MQESPNGLTLGSSTAEILRTIQGESAYKVWLAQGNNGSEQDFLNSLKGEKGKDGYTPKKGVDYFDGADGKDGINGRDGVDGKNGIDGKNGKDGAEGKNGADGQSAYQLWKALGNTGSEADFLASLKGADGKDGEDGKDADQAQIDLIVRQLEELEADVAFKEIKITSLKTNVGTVEKGTVMPEVKVSWQTNIPATEVLLNRMCGGSSTVHQWLGNVTEYVDEVKNIDTTTTYSLTVKDKRGCKHSLTTAANFFNGVYYGVVESGAEVGPSMLAGMTKKLLGAVAVDFSQTAGEGQKIAYAAPLSYGTPAFKDKDSGFAAGFDKAGEFEYTNEKGWTEMYQLWLSANENLGTTNISVSKG